MKQDNGILDRTGWFCRMQWTKIWLCAFAIAAIALGSGCNQSALAQVQALTGSELTPLTSGVNASQWAEPPVIKSKNGELNVTLAAVMAKNWMGDQEVYLRSYNGGLVGPTLELEAGDTLNLKLINDLPENDDKYCRPNEDHINQLHCFNTTNLHTHGLHVSPKGNSDNVLLSVKPGETQQYKFQIPNKHYPGTFWYHAHIHGSTAVDVASGMAGALILKDPDSSNLPDSIKNAKERIFIFQQLAFDNEGQIRQRDGEDMSTTLSNNFMGKNPAVNGKKKHTTINGQHVPLIEMKKGEVERWRFIHGGEFETLYLQLGNDKKPTEHFRPIALDGITLKNVRDTDHIQMVPGNRADVMVKAPNEPGVYWLYNNGGGSQYTFYNPPQPGNEILAKIEVLNQSCSAPCHSTWPNANDPLPRNNPLLREILDSEITRGQTMSFTSGLTINNEKFEPAKINYCLKKGNVEEWTLTSEKKAESHPFHMHVNAFQVVDPGQSGATTGDWYDTIFVKDGDTVKVRMRYEDFDGQFVSHCHILSHEDLGMMSLVEINNAGYCGH